MHETLRAIRARREEVEMRIAALQHELSELEVAERVIVGLPQGLDNHASDDREFNAAAFVWNRQVRNSLALDIHDGSSLTSKLLSLLQTLAGSGAPPVTAADLAGLVAHHFHEEVDQKSVSTLLSRLAQRGEIERVGEGRYSLTRNYLSRVTPPSS